MSGRLRHVSFAADLLPAVQNFACGTDPWHTEVSDWIKGPVGSMGAVDELSICDELQVWLYQDEQGKLAGFSSLNIDMWADGPTISLIPNVAIASTHQRKGYLRLIIGHLIHEAKKKVPDRQPILGLYVHPENTEAAKRYRTIGFVDDPQRWPDPATGIEYLGMLYHFE